MAYWQYLLGFGAGTCLVLVWIYGVRKKQKAFHRQEFIRKLDSLLQPKEKVLVVCPQKGGYCVLTNTQMLLEKRGKLTAFPLKGLRSIQGKNKDGNRTTIPANMVSLTVRFQQNVVLQNSSSEFEELTKLLQETMKKKSEQKKTASKRQ